MSNIESKLKKKISAFGSLTLKEFFTSVLYDKNDGYYAKKNIIGSKGDFITSPEISQVFGEMLSNWLMINSINYYADQTYNICELGPGRGTLMQDITRTIKSVDLATYNKIDNIFFYEESPSFINNLRSKIPKSKILKSLGEIPKNITFIIANEFFDAIPVDQYQFYEKNWYKNLVVINKKNQFQIVRSTKPSLINKYFPTEPKQNSIFEYSDYIYNILTFLFKHIKENGGMFLIIDYAKDRKEIYGTLSAINKHKKVSPFYKIGTSDISFKPDFNFFTQLAKDFECSVLGPVNQSYF